MLKEDLPFAFFVIPVVITAWRGGLGPSLVATAMSLVAVYFCFIEPRYTLVVATATGWITIATYLFTSLLICWYAERLRQTRASLEQKAARIATQQQVLLAEIEQRKQTQAALLESERRYQAVTEAIPQLVWTASPEGAGDYVNSQWQQYTGLPPAAAMGDRWLEVVHPDDRQPSRAAWDQALRAGRPADFDLRLRSRNGSYRWFKNRALPLRDPAGMIIKWFGTFTDIEILVEAKDALAGTNQALERRIEERTQEVERLKLKLQEENVYLREKINLSERHYRLVGQTPALRRVLSQAEQVAPTDSTVLLLGETGTGKEMVATAIHELSARRGRTLVSVNCAAMPAALVESELFGREKGAFTGSLSRQIGRFELADGATIFLDEIGELAPEIQVKLLRVLETKQIERLGNPKPIAVDVRVIAATNRDLELAVSEGKFRQDLYYRLNVFPISLPPLRERREDIPLLVWAFVDEFAKLFNKNIQSIEKESLDALQRYSWPGNVRELRNLIERAMIVATGPKLRIQLPTASASLATPSSRKLEEVERQHILDVLEKAGWRIRGVNGAAVQLGIKPTTLEARMVKLGIQRPSAVSEA